MEGENADRNLRSMLKHFRNLVDENASKATFLAAFKDKHKIDRMDSTHSSAASDAVKSELDSRGSDAELDISDDEAAGGAVLLEERPANGAAMLETDSAGPPDTEGRSTCSDSGICMRPF